LVHVEVQGQEEADFGRRMYVYNYRFGYSLWGCTVGFQFPVVKLLDYAADEAALEVNANPFAAVRAGSLEDTADPPGPRDAPRLEVTAGKGTI